MLCFWCTVVTVVVVVVRVRVAVGSGGVADVISLLVLTFVAIFPA